MIQVNTGGCIHHVQTVGGYGEGPDLGVTREGGERQLVGERHSAPCRQNGAVRVVVPVGVQPVRALLTESYTRSLSSST